MADRATANLPSRAFPATEAFYRQRGFQTRFRDEGEMMLSRGPLERECFLFPNLDPLTSWFSACIRVDCNGSLLLGLQNGPA